jgi:hypothetical protein
MLGHKRVTTTEGHYIAQDNTQLFADHHARIEALRHPGGRHDRRRQKSESSIFSGRCAK